MKGLMIQGTASDVGKSLVATAICRLLANEGVKVAPFKSQNMSNNSYVTQDAKEIGRAQGIQAEAAKTEASVYMNPILLKPRSDQHSEIVLFGKVAETLSGKSYRDQFYEKGLVAIKEALQVLEKQYDVLILEGAGSPVEMNLKNRELVNMKIAEMADVPVLLVADIDRGGVFASIIGTLMLLDEEERKRVKGILINKFRGDIGLFENGIKMIEEKAGIPVVGVLPHIDNHLIDREDSLSMEELRQQKTGREIDLAVIEIPFISNFSDIEPFFHEEDVSVRFVNHADAFGQPNGIIIPGTKSSIASLQFLKKTGLYEKILHYVENGGYVVGICGGYQLLGKKLIDEDGVDTGNLLAEEEGLGLIPAVTYFQAEKRTVRVKGTYHPQVRLGEETVEGYEIHLGQTVFLDEAKASPFFLFENQAEGYYRCDGRVVGTYLHHLFHNDGWRNSWLNALRRDAGVSEKEVVRIAELKDERYDRLACQMEKSLDWQQIKGIIWKWGNGNEDA